MTENTLPALRDRAAGTNVTAGFGNSASFDLMQRMAKAFAASTLVPKEYQNNIPNCLIALEMANRIGASPLLCAQNLFVVQGRPSWSAKFLLATFNQCGRFSSIRYEWQSEQGKKDWGCRAWAIEKSTGERVQSAWITWALVEAEGWNKKAGSKWLTMPEQMFMYRSAAWLVNTHAPEISMGLNTADELTDTFDAAPDASGSFVVSAETVKDRVEHALAAPAEPETIEIVATPVESDEPSQYAEDLAAIAEVATMSDFIKLLNSLPAKTKAELHGHLEAKQAALKAKDAASKKPADSLD